MIIEVFEIGIILVFIYILISAQMQDDAMKSLKKWLKK